MIGVRKLEIPVFDQLIGWDYKEKTILLAAANNIVFSSVSLFFYDIHRFISSIN